MMARSIHSVPTLANPNTARDDEFLFCPCSVVTVAEEPLFRSSPTPGQPHMIMLAVAMHLAAYSSPI